MREIKFRGRRIDNKEWVYGCYVNRHGRHSIVTQLPSHLDYDIQVEPESVGQYTGLRDATKFSELSASEQLAFLNAPNPDNITGENTEDDWKGREIYEGDVLISPHNSNKLPVKYGLFNDDWENPKSRSIGFCVSENSGLGLDIYGEIVVKVIN